MVCRYVYLWQRVSWMEEHEDVQDFMWVLQLTDDKVPLLLLLPPPQQQQRSHSCTAAALTLALLQPSLLHCCRKFRSFGRRVAAVGGGEGAGGKGHDSFHFAAYISSH